MTIAKTKRIWPMSSRVGVTSVSRGPNEVGSGGFRLDDRRSKRNGADGRRWAQKGPSWSGRWHVETSCTDCGGSKAGVAPELFDTFARDSLDDVAKIADRSRQRIEILVADLVVHRITRFDIGALQQLEAAAIDSARPR